MDNKDVVKEVVKKKPRGKNIGENLAPVTDPRDNAKYLAVGLKLFNLPPVDLKQPEMVRKGGKKTDGKLGKQRIDGNAN